MTEVESFLKPKAACETDIPHGTVKGYRTLDCRCDACRKANATYNTLWRKGRPVPRELLGPKDDRRRRTTIADTDRHGTVQGYIGDRCGCDACCAAHSLYNRLRRNGQPIPPELRGARPGTGGRPRKPAPPKPVKPARQPKPTPPPAAKSGLRRHMEDAVLALTLEEYRRRNTPHVTFVQPHQRSA